MKKIINIGYAKVLIVLYLLLISLILSALGISRVTSANSTDRDIGLVFILAGIGFVLLVVGLVGYEIFKSLRRNN